MKLCKETVFFANNNYDDYLDICVGMTDLHQDIYNEKQEINSKLRNGKVSKKEAYRLDNELFYKYLIKAKEDGTNKRLK